MIGNKNMNDNSHTAKTLLCGLLMLLCSSVAAQQEQLIHRAEAMTAYESFHADPVNKLDVAPTFLKFIETDGEAHIVLDPTLTAWMYEDHVAEARAVLYAAYMGGNMQAQLLGISDGDDPIKGMESVLHAYGELKKKYVDLSIPLLDSLAADAASSSLADAINKITNK
jgi:hypothetical protein